MKYILLILLFPWLSGKAESPKPNGPFEAIMRLRTAVKTSEFSEKNIETDLLTGKVWFWSTYTYTTAFSGNNMVIDGSTNTPFGVALLPGDVVNVQIASALPGWRCVKLLNLHGGETPTTMINIRFAPGAFVWRNTGSQIQESQLTNIYGVRIVNLDYQDNSDVAFRLLGTSQLAYLIIDSSIFRNFPTLFSENSSSMSTFGGDTTNMFRHVKILNSTFDSTQNATFGDFINVGAINLKDFWWDFEIANCKFTRLFSSGGPCHAGTLTNVLGFNIHDNLVDSFGMISNPNGHAAVWNIQGGFGVVKRNVHSHVFGNDFRVIGIYDMPSFGIVGCDTMYNNRIDHKRKYPGFEPRDNASDITTLSPYVRKRSRGYVDNNTFYSMAAGTGLSPPSAYAVAVYDWYGIDSIYMHNNVIAVVNDTTWAAANVRTLALGVGGSPVFVDSSNNVIAQFFSTSGLADTINYLPLKNGRLNKQGVQLSYFSTDIYGNNRTVPWDVGAAALLDAVGPITYGYRIIVQ